MSASENGGHVLLVTGGESVEHRAKAKRLTAILEASGRFQVSAVSVTKNGAPALATLPDSGFEAVVLAVDHPGKIPAGHAKGLAQFVEQGGGLVALHRAAVSFQENAELNDLLGSTVEASSATVFEYPFNFVSSAREAGHPVAARADDFVVRDAFLQIAPPEDAQVFAVSHVAGAPVPVGYDRPRGKGRIVYLMPGGEDAALANPYVQRVIERAVRYVRGERYEKTIRAGILGYGGAFNMGKRHAEAINAQHGMETVAVCDVDPTRAAQAKTELGDSIRTYTEMEALLADDAVDLIVAILPHNLHAQACIAASEAGKHVVTEKPFSITLDEADRMLAAAREKGTLVTCFHNRRWDGDFLQMLHLVRSGEIGELFHGDAASGGWGMPRAWWRSSKAISGGMLYDWGAHYVDWLLNFFPKRIESVSGNLQKRYWHNVTNEDFAQVQIRFEDGTTATLEQGSLVAIQRAGWRLLGTLGGLTNAGPGQPVTMVQQRDGMRRESELKPWEGNRWANFYQNVANHLIMGERLVVTAEQARRVIGVLELAERSNEQGGKPLALPGEEQYEPDYIVPW
ncbi:MAG: Gfo/Idh/MocA family oxidoreductase [Phycisphaeraceae bacterium]